VRMRRVLDTKRFQLRLMNAVVRTIQSRVRIFIAVRKVHSRRLARRRLDLDAATAANASAFTEKLLSEENDEAPAALCRCHQIVNCTCLQRLTTIKGTKVELFGLFLFGEQFVEKGARPLSPLSQLEAAVRNSTGVASHWNMTVHVMNREEEEKEEEDEEKNSAVDEETTIEKKKRLFSAFCVIDSNQLLTCAMELIREEEAMSGIHFEKSSKVEKRQPQEKQGGGRGNGGKEEEDEEEEEEAEEENYDGGGGKRQGGGFSFEDYYVEPQDDDDVYISPRTTLNDMIQDEKSKEKLFARIVGGLDLFLARSTGICKLVFVPSKIKPIEVFVDEEDGDIVCSL